jgi:hypothetical protein
MGRREFELRSAGTVRSSFRGKESSPQPFASAVSRIARVIQAPSRTRQEAVLDSSEAQLRRAKEEKEIDTPPKVDDDLLTFAASGRELSQFVGGPTIACRRIVEQAVAIPGGVFDSVRFA